jgi:vacuolar-type H+-ATPase subunit H
MLVDEFIKQGRRKGNRSREKIGESGLARWQRCDADRNRESARYINTANFSIPM